MTRQDIMKLDVHDLYKAIADFVDYKFPLEDAILTGAGSLKIPLYLCYQAEEKIKVMPGGKWKLYGRNLRNIVIQNSLGYFAESDLLHAHPKQRAQAVLLVVKEIK